MIENIIKTRRSISVFSEKKVDIKIIDEIIKVSSYAPSSCNTQPWYFIVFENEKSKERLKYYIDKGYDETKKN